MNIALVFGGPSDERGISLNSARSVVDHLDGEVTRIVRCIYVDRNRRWYVVPKELLYSNTPSDFDFKLGSLNGGGATTSHVDVHRDLFAGCDLVFPTIHGQYGEDGALQAELEAIGMPFVGSSSEACRRVFDKGRAVRTFEELGVGTIPTAPLPVGLSDEDVRALLGGLGAPSGEIVLKPAVGGSSLGVELIRHGEPIRGLLERLWAQHGALVAQPRMRGREFTTMVVEGPGGPVALPPVEVEVRGGGVFDYRRKYLASTDAAFFCPPRWPRETIAAIRGLSEDAFGRIGLADFARIDGWRTEDGELVLSDVNVISGMEQTSFMFVAAAQVGLDHPSILHAVLRSACRRHGLEDLLPVARPAGHDAAATRRLHVLFGGGTAERQVSVLSGTNVWLKLSRAQEGAVTPYLVSGSWEGPETLVWRLPHAAALHHSAEEIEAYCTASLDEAEWARTQAVRRPIADDVNERLGLSGGPRDDVFFRPSAQRLGDFLGEVGERGEGVFIALHGGAGEDGTLQGMLDEHGIPYNGSGVLGSARCMDKYETGRIVESLGHPDIGTARRWRVAPADIHGLTPEAAWAEAVERCGGAPLIVKPLGDGCSAGVLRIEDAAELRRYVEAVMARASRLTGGFGSLPGSVVLEMPVQMPEWLLIEEYIATDDIRIVPSGEGGSERLEWTSRSGWVEVTVGVVGPAASMRALTPSLTIAPHAVLTLEEKFMGGTGVNITPPPAESADEAAAADRVRQLAAVVANALGMRGYGRIDAFMERGTGRIIVIEANSLPGLTPATVIYHQALAESPPLPPRAFLEEIVSLAACGEDATD